MKFGFVEGGSDDFAKPDSPPGTGEVADQGGRDGTLVPQRTEWTGRGGHSRGISRTDHPVSAPF
jgi:hypothetical protein